MDLSKVDAMFKELYERLKTLETKSPDFDTNSSDRNKLYEALAKAQKSMKIARADTRGQYGAYASIESLKLATSDALNDNGISFKCDIRMINEKLYFVASLVHASGQYERSIVPYSPETSGSKNTMQAWGSANSYYERYLYRLMTGAKVSKDEEDPDSYPTAHHVDTEKPKPQRNEKKITEAQYKLLLSELKENIQLTRSLMTQYNVTSLKDLLFDDFQHILGVVRKNVNLP